MFLKPFSIAGVTQRSNTTLTGTTRTRCTAPPFPQPPPSVRQWWWCETAPGGATNPRCTWSRDRSPSAIGAPLSFTRNMPRTLTAPRSTTMPQAPVAGLSQQCSWSPARTQVPVSSTQRTSRMWEREILQVTQRKPKQPCSFPCHGGHCGTPLLIFRLSVFRLSTEGVFKKGDGPLAA